MSGPVTRPDQVLDPEAPPPPDPDGIDVGESREAQVGAFRVRRALPRRGRRTVGAWCFVDHMGPAQVTEDHGLDVAPHPHMGLQTVTWLLEGEGLHRDSLGNEQLIRAGELNLMTAGHGIAHSEEATGRYRGALHGVQLWVAQPAGTRDGPPAFEHHADLPRVDLAAGTATVLVGELDGVASPARRDTDHVGVDLDLAAGASTLPLRPDGEHALVVCRGAVTVEGRRVEPGHLAYLGIGRDELALTADGATRVLLVGGVPFEEPIVMWWNLVARDHDEVTAAWRSWQDDDGRFGTVVSPLPRIPVGPPPWARRPPVG
jgi:quercetin 2,3-dioxygenase